MEIPIIVEKEISLIGREDFEECEGYFSNHKLCLEAARCLIASHNSRLILAYAKYHSYDSFSETQLVELNDEDLLINYLQLRKFLWKDAELTLMQSNMVNAIRKAFDEFSLSEIGEVGLLRGKCRDLCIEYSDKWGFRSRDAKNLWIRMC